MNTNRGTTRLAGALHGLTLAAALLTVAVLPRGAAAQDIGLPLGKTPGAVEIEDLDGNPVGLGKLIGSRPVLVEFWATWCPLCEALAPRFAAAHKRFGDRVAFVTVAVAVNQSKRAIRRHLERHPIPGQVLWDTEGRATRAFQAPTTSYIVILDARGRVAYTGMGEDQELEAALEKVVGGGSPTNDDAEGDPAGARQRSEEAPGAGGETRSGSPPRAGDA